MVGDLGFTTARNVQRVGKAVLKFDEKRGSAENLFRARENLHKAGLAQHGDRGLQQGAEQVPPRDFFCFRY